MIRGGSARMMESVLTMLFAHEQFTQKSKRISESLKILANLTEDTEAVTVITTRPDNLVPALKQALFLLSSTL